jgi:hypothetical protein
VFTLYLLLKPEYVLLLLVTTTACPCTAINAVEDHLLHMYRVDVVVQPLVVVVLLLLLLLTHCSCGC